MKKFYLLIAICFLTTTTKAQWMQKGIDIDGEDMLDRSGYSVSMSDDGMTVAIGATYNYDGASGAGQVRIYQWNGSAWSQKGGDIDGTIPGQHCGYSVSMSADGNTVAVGIPANGGIVVSLEGMVRIFQWTGSSWSAKGAAIIGEAFYDESGFSVSMSADGNTVAIGAPYNDGTASSAGHVRIHEWNGSAWAQKGVDLDGVILDDLSGYSVSMSADGNTVAFGSPNINGIGHVRIYEWIGAAWTQKGANIDGIVYDKTGWSVSMNDNGNTIAIGAVGRSGTPSDSGNVRIYQWIGATWSQKGNDIVGEAGNELSGWSVSMSSDGNTVAIGTPLNSGTGFWAGHVRVYEWKGIGWIQKGIDIDGKATYDQSGYSISLSSDGNTVAIGAPQSYTSTPNPGYVSVYSFTPVDITEYNFGDRFQLYPNPTDGNFSIDFFWGKINLTATLTNALGKVISIKKYNSADFINMNIDAPTGIYFLKIETTNRETKTIKVLKK